MADEACFTETYDVLDQHGQADDPAAWAAIERVRQELAELGEQTGRRGNE